MFINFQENDSFSRLRGQELLDLINEIESFYLFYRDNLGLDSNVTFGLEIEYEAEHNKDIKDFITYECDPWLWKTDFSLSDGGEINSPVLRDTKKTWEMLKKVCEYLKKMQVKTTDNAAGHIHIGAHILGEDLKAWYRFVKLYACYEHVLYRFYFGDKLIGRPRLLYFAASIANTLRECLKIAIKEKTFEDTLRSFFSFNTKFQSVNFGNVNFYDITNYQTKNTIELRSPNATDEEIIWQNNVNTAAKMVTHTKSGLVDEDFLDFKLSKTPEYQDYTAYINSIHLTDALEFVDLVFDRNIDKIFFLRQYLRNFEDNSFIKEPQYAKIFIRK